MHFKPKHIFLVHCLLSVSIAHAQVQAVLKQPALNKLTENDLFNATLTLTANENVKVYLLGSVKQELEVYTSRSEAFTLKPGINTVSQLHITQSEFLNAAVKNTVKQTANFPTGNYTLCIRIMRKDDDTEVGSNCITHSVLNEVEQANATVAATTSNKLLGFYGYGTAEYFNASRQGTNQVVPDQYFRADVHPSVSLFDVPVTANVFFSTEQQPSVRQNMITYNLAFDAVAFRNRLKTEVTQHMQAAAKAKGLGNVSALSKLKDLEGVEQQLQSGDYTALDEKIKSLPDESSLNASMASLTKCRDSLEQLSSSNDSAALKLIETKKQLYAAQEKYRQLQDLQYKKEKYEKLLAQKNELDALKAQMDNAEKIKQMKNFDYNTLNDPTVLRSQLKQFGMFNGVNKFFYGVRDLKIGTCFPYYSPLVLDGVQVQGASAEVQFGGFNIAATGGKTQNALVTPDTFSSVYKQKMLAIKAGFGNSYGSHIFFTYLKAIDNESSIPNDTALGIKPQSNFVVGSELQLAMLDNHFIIKGEGGLCEHIHNQNDEVIAYDSTNVPIHIPSEIRPNYSTTYDYAYTASTELHLFKNNTMLRGSYRNVAPGYVSFGAPLLRRDVSRYEIALEQKLFKNQMSLTAFYKNDHDNQLDTKGMTTTFENLGASARMHFRKMPYLDVSYMPYNQQNDLYTYKVHIATAVAGYNFRIKKTAFNTTASYNFSKNETTEQSNQFQSDYLMLNESVTLPLPLTLSACGSFINTSSDTIQSKTLGLDFGLSFTLFKKLNTSLGFTYYNDKTDKQNIGGHAELSLRILKYFNWTIRGEFNDYNSNITYITDPNYIMQFEELQFRTGLQVNW